MSRRFRASDQVQEMVMKCEYKVSNDEASNARFESTRPKRCYRIRFKGHLGDHWTGWFHRCSLTREEDGTTTIIAPAVDRAELFGLLDKLRDLSLSLISVNEIEPLDESTDS